jgi:RHS repeat-associated protein
VHLVSDYQGRVYEHIEYTPYGELWVEHGPEGLEAVPYRFTGKELDEETGLYYYGARYLNPRTSRWVSADPELQKYLPERPVDEEARRRNQNLPGIGGVFNPVNLAVYHYSRNNSVKYVDPTGDFVLLGGITITGSIGFAVSFETGIAISRDRSGQWQVGMYVTPGAGILSNVSASATASFTFAPFAQEIGDISGLAETLGGTGGPSPLAWGFDVNIPLESELKNISITGNIGVGAGILPAEGHMLTTKTAVQVFGTGGSFAEAWESAKEAGLFENYLSNLLELINNQLLEPQFSEQSD